MNFSNNPKIPRKKMLLVIALLIFLLLWAISAVSFIDLAVNSTSIAFSNNNPVEGEKVNISAMINNLGNETATGAIIQFLDDAKEISNATITVLNYSSATASLLWPAEMGPNIITVVIDPDNHIVESSETNNQASKNISINAYHAYYGTTKSYVGLGINYAFMFRTEFRGCNILVADTDSNIDFSSLQAINRKINGARSENDFEEIDALLGMANFDDSITNLFSKELGKKRVPKQVETFTVFNTAIPFVPVMNSTNSTAFLTGILWDASDDTNGRNGQYDIIDQEDLVFITKVNQLQQGQYGIYNYEIKIPAPLRNYKPGNPTVDFFIDVDSNC